MDQWNIERAIEPPAKLIPRRGEIRRQASEGLGRRIYAEPVRRGFLAVKRAKKSPCARVRCSYPEPDKTPILCPGATGVVHQWGPPSITAQPKLSARQPWKSCGSSSIACAATGNNVSATKFQLYKKHKKIKILQLGQRKRLQKPLGTKSKRERR